jgi:hypothetical protein
MSLDFFYSQNYTLSIVRPPAILMPKIIYFLHMTGVICFTLETDVYGDNKINGVYEKNTTDLTNNACELLYVS